MVCSSGSASTRRSTQHSARWSGDPLDADRAGGPGRGDVAINPRNGAIRAMVSVAPGSGRSSASLRKGSARQARPSRRSLSRRRFGAVSARLTSYVSAVHLAAGSAERSREPRRKLHGLVADRGHAALDNSVCAARSTSAPSIVRTAHQMGVRRRSSRSRRSVSARMTCPSDMASAYATLAGGDH
jgi:hypothetical protein